MRFCSFCFEQFFLYRSVANLMMLTIDVCLMLNCFLIEKFYLHYALCDFDSILWHCTKLFMRQRVDFEKKFWCHFWTPPLKNPAYATDGFEHQKTWLFVKGSFLISHLKFYLYCRRKDEAQRHVELNKINPGEPASKRRRSYEIKDQRLRNAASCWSSRPSLEYLLTNARVI